MMSSRARKQSADWYSGSRAGAVSQGNAVSGRECGSNPARPGTWQTGRTGPAFPGVRQTLVERVLGHKAGPSGQAYQNICLGEMLVG